MAKKDLSPPRSENAANLRQVAEEVLKLQGKDRADSAELTAEEAARLAHELHVHQVELEMQNEELRQRQLELQAARDKYADLYDFAPMGYFTLDEKGTIIEANLTGCVLLGVERSKLVGRPLARFVAPESQDALHHHRKDALKTKSSLSLIASLVRANGTGFVANVESLAALDPRRNTLTLRLAVSDVTRQAEAERALAKSEEKYRTLISNIPVITWTRDGQGTVVFVSPNAEAVCGFTAEEIIGTDMRFWKKQLHPEDAPLVIQSFMQMLSRGQTLDIEYRFRRKDGTWIWLLSRALRRTEERNAVRVDGIIVNITERKRAEEIAQELQRKQLSMEKQAALGKVAATVAHEINNPLAGIQNAFLMLKKAVSADHPNFMFVELIDREIHRIGEIIRQMTLLYRPVAGRRCESEAVRAVAETLQILASDTRSRGITFKVINDVPELSVRIHDGELRQVIYNIVINALQVSPPDSEIVIQFDRDRDQARICVTDHGPGIPDDILPHIFKPFFTTTRPDDNSDLGLGLSVSRDLVQAAGGQIEVKTRVGEGSTFTVVLPCIQTGSEGAPV